LLKIQNISVKISNSIILKNIDMYIKKGLITCIMGKNGMGKTTLLETIIGHHNPYLGNINYNGKNIEKLLPYERAKLGLAYVPQGREIFPRLTVKENLFTGLSIKNNKYKIDSEVLSLFPILNEMQDRFGGDLSGGQQQQLAIARALLMRPKVLILDEPTEGIQPSIIKIIRDVILHVKEVKKTTIVLVEQYFDFVQDIADEVVIMDRGKVFKSGKVKILKDKNIKNILAV
jgi:urea transport system ATP-binding protein